MNRGRACVAGGGAKDVDRLPALRALVFVEIAEELEREIFEGERGPVEEFEDGRALVEFHDGRDVGVRERRVALLDDRAERVGRDVGREEFEKLKAQLVVGKFLKASEVGRGKLRKRLGQVEAAVRRKTGGDGIGEAEGRSLSAGGDEAQGEREKKFNDETRV